MASLRTGRLRVGAGSSVRRNQRLEEHKTKEPEAKKAKIEKITFNNTGRTVEYAAQPAAAAAFGLWIAFSLMYLRTRRPAS
jgi:hypothetical protein